MTPRQGSEDPVSEKPAAHFQANPSILGSLTWSKDIDNSFIQGNLTLENNKLHVKQKGLYFIYSQAMFGGRACPQQNKNFISLSVILESFRGKDNSTLLRADKTPCNQPYRNTGIVPGWSKSIFLGAVFRLVKGDILYVTVSGAEFLRRERGTTYFGAYAL
ncbi:lymphotoxin-alpha-like [Anomaloglossus baeobatrachus]|uniref:lymphotoxin-alpha-like n=1 Tax=Anomaloglossus baeobatrachus TaxID=238106 RepID=UPI003F4FE4DE